MSTVNLIDHMPDVAEKATNRWARNFATSICKQSLRPGWKPSRKQSELMRLMVRQLADAECEDFDLFDMEDVV